MSSKHAAARTGVWSIVLQWSRFGLNAVVFLILARWLSLEEIGAFAIAFAPINLLQLVQRAGFSETVVQGRTELDESTDTIFWMSAGFGIVVSLCLFGLSFVIGPITGSEASGTYLAAMAVVPALIGVAAVPEGLLRQRLEVRTLALRTTTSLTVAGALALWLGHAGYGGWALTVFAIVNALLSSVLVVALVRWRPGGGLRRAEMRKTLPVLMAISGRGLATNATMPLLQLMIGAALGPAAAGAFQIADRFMTLADTATLTPLRFAALPIFVQVRSDVARLSRVVAETAGLVSLVSAPIYFGLLAVAPVFLPLAVGEENGTASVLTLQALLLRGGHVALFLIFSQSLTAIGRSGVAFAWFTGFLIANLIIAAFTVLHSAALTALASSLLGYVAAPFVIRSLLRHAGVPPRELTRAILGPAIAAAAMAAAVLFFDHAFGARLGDLSRLVIEIALGALIYTGLSLVICWPQIVRTRSLLATLLPRRFHA